MTETTSFDLRTSPWIAVRTDRGIEEVSLLELFDRAGEIRALAGEIPSQDVAILRLLLVILRRGLPQSFDYPHERWA
ncbi:MAG: type I-E CRISPR-associated protein Cse1/CasA, partial [Tetrasphaera sp.]|nr:type I-E CRISPR-associated protein Cse1/CasA [Tetrasphaera sp.]